MQLDELKSTWKKEISMKDDIPEFEKIRRSADNFDRRSRVGWAIELVACVGVIVCVVLAWLAWAPTEQLKPMFQIGMFAMIAASVFVFVKIIWARRVSRTKA